MTTRKYYLAHKDKWQEYNRNWYENNRERKLQMGRDRALEKRLVVLDYYSNEDIKCARCGITDIDILCLDHINGGGNQQRKVTPHTYRWIINNDFPDGFQVLCYNCNWKKRINSED